MNLFPKEIMAVATRNRTLATNRRDYGVAPIVLTNEIDVRETLRAIPGREKFLLLLALLATSKDSVFLRSSDLEKLAKEPATAQMKPSSEQVAFLAKISERHGHSTTFTIAAIHGASRSPYFEKSIFSPAREQDPHLWSLMWNFGRPRMPASVFAPYALFEAERLLGEPIRDLTKIASYLVPADEAVDGA
ncbi:hypothetical protein [Rhizobium sp. MHM7A]|uniref:hypothetical protein n=1 Tax=Rhizobium sp. MHM7A TaxID=2583233 RepID=UPI001106F1A4|nr:hypothetical protein [Rhizobium sp. MHM7A]TLX16187.1 hypothetical protein FFR93_02345 [Rhizobium sp. MHM7A]